ncbi:class I SAM-dependent methyltransferase [Streptomyces sp. SID3343]|uniref:class I SAM-dependent methyltransferase n=1 Tax=Streptomyces sp. SID3343 TaxID=2690260 RepID=UPI001369CC72|nr:class I SAM-dependent methyltransferase [Streptomyces sp. SID3343]MYV98028.1 methyltransferase domain-containing protein [Streptomyces sp. SID3343]
MGDTRAFDDLAEGYQRFRPDYPQAAWETLRGYVGPDVELLVDVGAGTGIATRALRATFGAGPDVVGVEPGEGMRAQAENVAGDVRYVAAPAEALPFADGSASLVLTAQALHWFDRPAFYAEATRVLRPGGVIAVLVNDRDTAASSFLQAYEDLLERHNDDYSRDYRHFPVSDELDAAFGMGDDYRFGWSRRQTRDEFVGTALSSSKTNAVVRKLGEAETRAAIGAVLALHFAGDDVEIPFTTSLFLRRRSA